jgi:DNA-binding NarL/FixJ family response regulator
MTDAPARILYIENEAETAALLAEDLSERGYEVSVALDGRAGLSAILKFKPDVVLCDINMAQMSGFDVLEELNAVDPKLASMPFIFLTGLADRDSELRGRRLGAGDYVVKPADFDVLHEIIQKRLSTHVRARVWRDSADLNEREIETLTWAARGKTSLEIATIVGLSKRTVDFHIDNARDKLGVATRIQAAVKAASSGIIDP